MHAPKGNKLIIVFDYTYLFIQKSANFEFQRNSYCMHKHKNIIKPMMAVFFDGLIGAAYGSYPGSRNDASIMTELINEMTGKVLKEETYS